MECIKSYRLVNSLCKRMSTFAGNDVIVSDQVTQFFLATKNFCGTEMLLWCASLLIEFHKKRECCKFMSLALKLQLESYKRSSFLLNMSPQHSCTIAENMFNFLSYISLYKINDSNFVECIRVFFHYFKVKQLDKEPNDSICKLILPRLLKIAHEIHFNIFTLWSDDYDLLGMKYTQRAIIEDFSRFRMLVSHGYEDRYFKGAIQEYKNAILKIDKNNLCGVKKVNIGEETNRKYRCFQYMFLYVKCLFGYDRMCDNHQIRLIEHLSIQQLLWETIPDPFLSQKEFFSCFARPNHKLGEFILSAWESYAEWVLDDLDEAPRSLKHLSRCVIRRTLTENVQPITDATQSLDIPSELQSYLCVQ